jgi:cytochrome c553
MKALAATLDDSAMKNLSAFYAAQQPQPPKVSKPVSLAEWAQRCDRCHGVNGNSTDPRLPALAAQRADYLQKVLNAYRTGARKSPANGGHVQRIDLKRISRIWRRITHARKRVPSSMSRCPASNVSVTNPEGAKE